jgi:hypothetical protein
MSGSWLDSAVVFCLVWTNVFASPTMTRAMVVKTITDGGYHAYQTVM